MSDSPEIPTYNIFGRPTKYDEGIIQRMLEFFNIEAYEDGFRGRLSNKFPTFERFAIKENVTHKTLLRWKVRYPDFCQAYDACKELQKALCVEGGMAGTYNATITKFIALNVSDLKDTVTHESTGEVKINIDADDAKL